ncbi:MAG: NADH-quinone oxidoreductase subunit C [Nitrospiria bacterium]
MDPIALKIQEKYHDVFLSSNEDFSELTITLKREGLVDVCRFLHDTPSLDFDLITDICSVDFPNETPRFEVIYQLYSIDKNHRIRLKARVPEEDCTIDSVVGIWQGANFMEREVYDMMGIRFNNHPDLRRILMTEDYDEGYPLRKDFPVEGYGWRDRFDFSEQ